VIVPHQMKNAMENEYTHLVLERTAETSGVAARNCGSNRYIAQIAFHRILNTDAPGGASPDFRYELRFLPRFSGDPSAGKDSTSVGPFLPR